jgi:hypothetical protein
VSDLVAISRRLDALLGRGSRGVSHVVVINRALPAWPGGQPRITHPSGRRPRRSRLLSHHPGREQLRQDRPKQ